MKYFHKLLSYLFAIITTLCLECCFASHSVKTTFELVDNNVVWSIENVGTDTVDEISLDFLSTNQYSIKLGYLDANCKTNGLINITDITSSYEEGNDLSVPILISYYADIYRSSKIGSFSKIESLKQKENSDYVRVSSTSTKYDNNSYDIFVSGYLSGKNICNKDVNIKLFLPNNIIPIKENDVVIKSDETGFFEHVFSVSNKVDNLVGNISYAIKASSKINNDIVVEKTCIDFIDIDNQFFLKSIFPELLSIKWLIVTMFTILIVNLTIKKDLLQKFSERYINIFEYSIVVFVCVYFGYMLNVYEIITNSGFCTGGDLPAHHYIVKQIQNSKSIFSWAQGWWSGFPIFRYYFCLPYFFMALFSSVFNHNIVFNIGIVFGVLVLPITTFIACKKLNLPRPLPTLFVCMLIPLVMDNTHSMWGINAYSTLSGMIANSWSFSLFLLAFSCVYSDAKNNRISFYTPIALAAVIFSHFFTSIMLAFLILFLLVSYCCSRRFKQCKTILVNGFIALFMVVWWLVPLVLTREWSIDFGTDWDIRFLKQLPPIIKYFFLPTFLAFIIKLFLVRKNKFSSSDKKYFGLLFLYLYFLVISIFLFYFGRQISDVFVNCRIWPFIVYSLLCLIAIMTSYICSKRRISCSIIALLVCMTYAWNTKSNKEPWASENYSRAWAKFNFNGVEGLRKSDEFYAMCEDLRGVNGRISSDLHHSNTYFGSSRIFESLPYLIDKEIIEGGIVNSALGSLMAYSVQGEVSDSPAGWPLLVKPQLFNPSIGLRHLEFMGVTHFIARSNKVKDAFDKDAAWDVFKQYSDGMWKIYKSKNKDFALVRKWNNNVRAFESDSVQKDLIEWVYYHNALENPCIILPKNNDFDVVYSNDEYYDYLKSFQQKDYPINWLDKISEPVEYKLLPDGSKLKISIKTPYLDEPHIIFMSYYPNWHVKDKKGDLYPITPGYMVLFPKESNIEVVFQKKLYERILNLISSSVFIGLVLYGIISALRKKNIKKENE